MTQSEVADHFTSPRAAVERARRMLELEQALTRASDSFFDTIVVNEIAPAFALALRMLKNYSEASDAVHVALERARANFSDFDGAEPPRSWLLGYVADEAVHRSARQGPQPGCDDHLQQSTESALHCLAPRHRLAVILTDVLGMTDGDAASVARVDMGTVRRQASSARVWLARHLAVSTDHRTAVRRAALG